MTRTEQAETEIRELLASETSAILLSNKLFGPDGLFHRLATTAEERDAVAQSPLFKQAQKRLAELRRREAAEFARAVEQARPSIPDGDYLLRLEPVSHV